MFKPILIFALSFLLGGGLNGCGDGQPPQHDAKQRSGLAKAGQSDWLDAQDETRPEVWLIGHEEKAAGKSSIGDPGDVRRSLIEASEKFHDSPRMIANRAMQLEEMLKDEGGGETAIVLIGRLNGAIAPGRIESFGAAGQQYYNMRKAGFTVEQAIIELSKRYGSRS